MKAASLAEARQLYRARRFADVIRVLEPDVFKFRESFEYFQLLGFSCLHAGDLGGAFSYISRARQLVDDDVSVLLGLAAVHFRRAENETALKRWLEVLEIQPENPTARRGLEILRRGLTADQLQELTDSGRLKLLYPPLPGRAIPVALIIAVLGVLVLAGAAVLLYRITRPGETPRPGVSVIEIPDGIKSYIDPGTDFTFVLSEREVRQAFQKAKEYLLSFRDNLAAVEINRIFLSNAAPAVKERARMLKGFITLPTFDTLRDPFPYATVARRPALYDGCTVKWKGKIANLANGKDAIVFDLLVGYDQERQLEGIVAVKLGFAAELANGAPLEVLGQVIARGDLVTLEGISVHSLASP
jgi:hypothetical protein